ncbi:g3277 [Coccomyxa viridis]|uniref:G3277 protein n=1 Tax=Coccomyxa viridis TaxID=1274662 RepID=A0ABP1FME4_9CHLO
MERGCVAFAIVDIPNSAPLNSLADQTSPSSFSQWDGSIPTYTQLMDELEKPEPFLLSAWAERRDISARTEAHQPPTDSSQAPCLLSARAPIAQSATVKALGVCMPAAELSLPDTPAASQADATGQARLLAGKEHSTSRSGPFQAARDVVCGKAQRKEQPRQLLEALQPESAVTGVSLRKQPGQAKQCPARQADIDSLGQKLGQAHRTKPEMPRSRNNMQASSQPKKQKAELTSQPVISAAEVAVESKRPLRLSLMSVQPHDRKNFRIKPEEEPISASGSPLWRPEQESGSDRLGNAISHLHEPCKPVQMEEEPVIPSLIGADPHASLSSAMQSQQRERRQFQADGEEAALDLNAQLWRRKQSRRNGVQHLWNKAVQVKEKSAIGKVKVEH